MANLITRFIRKIFVPIDDYSETRKKLHDGQLEDLREDCRRYSKDNVYSEGGLSNMEK
jgi:hypothetical protein